MCASQRSDGSAQQWLRGGLAGTGGGYRRRAIAHRPAVAGVGQRRRGRGRTAAPRSPGRDARSAARPRSTPLVMHRTSIALTSVRIAPAAWARATSASSTASSSACPARISSLSSHSSSSASNRARSALLAPDRLLQEREQRLARDRRRPSTARPRCGQLAHPLRRRSPRSGAPWWGSCETASRARRRRARRSRRRRRRGPARRTSRSRRRSAAAGCARRRPASACAQRPRIAALGILAACGSPDLPSQLRSAIAASGRDRDGAPELASSRSTSRM